MSEVEVTECHLNYSMNNRATGSKSSLYVQQNKKHDNDELKDRHRIWNLNLV